MVARPLVTVLMPTHTRVDVIGYAIESMLRQTMGDFELLIVGDGCVPGTAEVAASFSDSRVRFLDLPKAPAYGYANRNLALRESKGQFIGFAADDDLFLPDHLELLVQGLQQGAAFAYSQAFWVSTDGIVAPFLTNLTLADELTNFLENGNSIPASSVLYRADSLPQRDAWREDVESAADWHLWRDVIRQNPERPIAYIRKPTMFHFSAKRKQSRHSLMPPLATLLAIADTAAWWPTILKAAIPARTTEQQVYADLMRPDPQGWCTSVRRASADLVDRLAWEDIVSIRPAFGCSENRLSACQDELAEVLRTVEIYRKKVAQLVDDAAWAQENGDRLSKMLTEANEKIELKSREIAAMQTTLSWRLRGFVKTLRSGSRRKKG